MAARTRLYLVRLTATGSRTCRLHEHPTASTSCEPYGSLPQHHNTTPPHILADRLVHHLSPRNVTAAVTHPRSHIRTLAYATSPAIFSPTRAPPPRYRYTIDLVILYLCFRDKKIELWESALMLSLYLCYVGFMKFNSPAERFVKVGSIYVADGRKGGQLGRVCLRQLTAGNSGRR